VTELTVLTKEDAMKRMNGWLVALVLVVCGVLGARAVEIRPLPIESQAQYGATHFVEVSWRDFTKTATNTPEVLTFSVPAKSYVESRSLVLVEAFDTAKANLTNMVYTNSVTLEVGDSVTSNRFVTSTQVATDSTPVWFKYGVSEVEYSTATLTNVVYGGGATTGNLTYVTSVTGDLTGAGRAYYATNDTLRITVTGYAFEALKDNVKGKAIWYLRFYR
jgi:hypothetical protein